MLGIPAKYQWAAFIALCLVLGVIGAVLHPW